MHLGVYIDMRNHHALPTIALLSSYLEKEKKDYLHLISPFVQCCLPIEAGSVVDVKSITSSMRKRYGFEDIPTRVVELILQRLSSPLMGSEQLLVRERYQYIVKKPYDCSLFNKERGVMRERINSVLEKLGIFLDENYLHKKISLDDARDFFIHFFETYGWTIAKDKEKLRTVTSDDGKHNFYVARFILEQYDNQTIISEYITEIIKGFLVYKALYYFSSEKKTSIQSKLRDVVFYLDCSLVIDCLGYDCIGDEESLDELVQMILDMGGRVAVFSHIIEETCNLLDAYAKHGRNRNAFNFPQLQSKNLSSDILEMYISSEYIQSRLLTKKIELIDAPSYETDKDSSLAKQYMGFQDETRILEQLKSYSTRSSVINNHKRHDYDLRSLAAVGMLRKSRHPRIIENSCAILITQDRRLCWCMHDLYPKEFPPETDFAFRDVDLISILWVGQYNKESSLPKDLLIANASAACQLSPDIMTRAIQLADQMQVDGKIDPEAALVIRTMPIIKKYLFEKTYNNVSSLSEDAILQIIDKYVIDSTQDSRDEAIKKAVDDRIEKQYVAAVNTATNKATKYSTCVEKLIFWGLSTLHALLAFAAIFTLFYTQNYSNTVLVALLIAFCIFCVFQIVDIFLKGLNIIRKLSRKGKTKMFTWMYAKKLREFKSLIEGIEI
jgi:hypothetical protein